MDIQEEIKQVGAKATDYSGSPQRKIAKGVLGVVIVILLGALGLEGFSKDFDLGTLMNGGSVKDATLMRDTNGNIQQDAGGNFITNALRDKLGNVVPEGTAGAKLTNEYNCSDFSTQTDAQVFFDKAGGVAGDTNRLDGDKDGAACESLPK